MLRIITLKGSGAGGEGRSTVAVVRVSPCPVLASGLTTGQNRPGLGPCQCIRLGVPAGESVRAVSRVAGDSGDSDPRKCRWPESTYWQLTVARVRRTAGDSKIRP